MNAPRSAFDATYYRRFYEDPATCSVSAPEVDRQLGFVTAYLAHLGVPLRSVLDMGCGTGLMGEALSRIAPQVRYHGVDASPYACERYGWEPGSVVDYRSRRRFDLVICHDVIQYLGHRDAARAIENLARLSREALLLAVLTREDHDQQRCDPARTDVAVALRSNRWYRQHLRPHFLNLGGGLFLKRDRDPVLWSLEHLD